MFHNNINITLKNMCQPLPKFVEKNLRKMDKKKVVASIEKKANLVNKNQKNTNQHTS